MGKKIITLLILSSILLTNGVAQQISTANYNTEIIQEDFNSEGNFFPIITTTDNYFILDKGDYLLSRNNKDSEYAIIANNSSANNFILKTSVRIGPSNNKKASLGIIIKAQQDGKGAIIVEINKKREYRIKQLIGTTYKILSGSNKQQGWVKEKAINGVDEHNLIEIRSEDNIYDLYLNSKYLTTFFIPDYTNGSFGIIISPETKARIAYYHIKTKGENKESFINNNTENTNTTIESLNKKIEILEKNNAALNTLNGESRKNQDEEINTLTQKNNDLYAITIEKEKEIINLQRSITDLKNNVTTLTETTKNLNTKNTDLASAAIEKEKEIINLQRSITDLKDNVATLTETTKSLNAKNTDLASVTIEQEKEIKKTSTQLTNLKSKNTELASLTMGQETEIKALSQSLTNINKKNTDLKNDLTKINKSSNTKQTQFTTKTTALQLANADLKADLTIEKQSHTETKNQLSKTIKNKVTEINSLTREIKETKEQLKSITTINAKNKETSTELNQEIINLKNKIKSLESQIGTANAKLIDLKTTNTELKELFILKDFEINGIKPSDLTQQTNTSPETKELKTNNTIYSVQFGVYMKIQPYAALKKLDNVWYETTKYGTYVYLSGKFNSSQEATKYKNQLVALGYPNAFVVTLTK